MTKIEFDCPKCGCKAVKAEIRWYDVSVSKDESVTISVICPVCYKSSDIQIK